MPRQPLSKVCSAPGIFIGPGALTERPAQAALIGECVGLWAEVDLWSALLLAVLLKVQTDAAIAVFLSIRQGRPQRDAIWAAAQKVLPERDQELCQAVLAVHRSIEKLRTDLAHGCFGICHQVPDGILWVEPVDEAHFFVQMWTQPAKASAEVWKLLGDRIYVYRQQDLEEVRAEILALRLIMFTFAGYLRDELSSPSTLDELYRQQCAEPRIQRALEQIRQKALQKGKS